jgi:hypothetical protein
MLPILYRQSHNGIDYIIVVLLQCLNSFVFRDTRLLHNQFNILRLDTSSIYLLIILFVILLVVTCINSLALAIVVRVVVARVIMARVIVRLLGSQLLGSGCLGLRVKVLNLSLTEDTETVLADT